MLGVDQVFQMGGAQAIAAFAFGTKTVPRADRIVGPGQYLRRRGQEAAGGRSRDRFRGRAHGDSDHRGEGDPQFLAADMLAQAEHDTDASAILLTTSRRLAQKVAKEVERQFATLADGAVARKAIDKNSAIVIVDSLDEAVRAFERIRAGASDAFIIEELLPKIRHAGSIFIGPYSPEAAGDYVVGTESRAADQRRRAAARRAVRRRLRQGDFGRSKLDLHALAKLAPSITTLARAEGLEAHARSVEVRLAVISAPRKAVLSVWPPTRRQARGARTSCVSISTKTRWAVRRVSSSSCKKLL